MGDIAISHKDGRIKILIALVALYITWSTTYLGIKFALESFPPFFLAGIRYFLVGAGLFIYLRIKGQATPDRAQWAGATAVGGLLLLGGTGGVSYAQQWVASGIKRSPALCTPISFTANGYG